MSVVLKRIFGASFFVWLGLACVGLYFLIPLKKHIKFGIDLAGGTYITLSVKTEEAVRNEINGKLHDSVKYLKRQHISKPVSQALETDSASCTFYSIDVAQKASSLIRSRDRELLVNQDGTTVTLSLPDNVKQRIKEWAIQSNVDVLRARLDKVGVSEITVTAQGERNIVVELPDVKDPQLAKSMIGKTAMLEIKVVEKISHDEDELLEEFEGDMPEGMTIVPGSNRRTGKREHYLLPDYTEITGRLLKDARPELGGKTNAEPVVAFQFSERGGELFQELTGKSHGRQLAIIIDGEVVSAPVVNETISRSGTIQGGFAWEEARELAMLLKSGSFVAPVAFEEERQVGPSLGTQSIKQGLIACLISLLLLLLFSVFYYRVPGIFAFFALLYNMVLVLLGLAWLKATLTLPGVAGIVLTVGMAIDASILIYEKIKEVLADGGSLKKAINEGFSDAMVVIIDANLTTFIVGLVLYRFGAGPIQGFAVTMMLGVVATLITGLFFLRSLLNFVVNNLNVQNMRF